MFKSFVKTNLVVAILLSAASVFAQSFYSAHGYGVTSYFVSAKSVSMGGTGLGFYEDVTQAYLNPASLSALSSSFITGNFVHEASDLSSANKTATITNTSFQGVQFSFPFKARQIALSLGVMPYSLIGYSGVETSEKDGKVYRELLSGSGGLNTGFLSFAIAPFRMIRLGVSGLYYFGQLRNRWEVSFDGSEYDDTRDEISQSAQGGNFRFGAIVQIRPRWTIGLVYSFSKKLPLKKQIVSTNLLRFTNYPQNRLDIPQAVGVGTSFYLTRKLQLALDYYTEKWSATNLNEQGYLNDSKRIGFGVDFLPSRLVRQRFNLSYWSRVAYRLGFYYRDLGLEVPEGQSVAELFGTFGLGLPIKSALARCDLALEIGKRGSKSSNPFEEMVVRFTGSITAGETWFKRGRR